MICALHIRKSRSTRICPGDRVHDPDRRLLRTFFDTKIGRGLFLLSTAAVVAGLSVTARSQSSSDTEDSSGAEATTISGQLDQTYARSTHMVRSQLREPRLLPASISLVIPHLIGTRELKGSVSDLVPTLPLRPLERRRGLVLQKPSRKIHSTTAANAPAYGRGWVTL